MAKGFLIFVLMAAMTLVCVSVKAQTGDAHGSYSPYTVFGLGDIAKEGTAFNKGMGGVGVALRNRRYINPMNPASLSAIDSSSFMADFGLIEDNKIFRQNLNGSKLRSADNVFNINNFVIAFPVYKSLAFMVGISPFSDVGYDFTSVETDQNLIGNTSPITYAHYGEGSVYQIFFGAGVEFWKRLSIGAQMNYYFGTLDRAGYVDFYDAAYQNVVTSSEMVVRGMTAKFGVQYDQPFGRNLRMTIGATYRMGTNLRGDTEYYQLGEQSSIQDTISYSSVSNKGRLKIADELGVGISLRKGEKWSVEVDYLRSDWRRSGYDNYEYTGVRNNGFAPAVSQSFRAGFEIVPNRNDIRYYMKRVTYRAGIYYNQDYYTYYGDMITSKGITIGLTFPIYRLYNGLTIGVDFGQRGSLKNSMIREMYATISVGFNIHDIWFRQQKYD